MPQSNAAETSFTLAAISFPIYRKKIPVILCYEGWDAAGKGGNIRRVAFNRF